MLSGTRDILTILLWLSATQTCSMRTLVFTLDIGNLNDHEVRVFCAAAMSPAPSLIEFPQVAEIHINGTTGNITAQVSLMSAGVWQILTKHMNSN